ncbi:amino acid permease [Pediococcus acidilactici]|uniref:APC family permease n=1 Tax=Pediococcus acidilactici TaxID=1254 RepID=UPI00132BCEF3|nr:amino acid permease [Pediococcus acidilactici]KAF0333997.1 amino acid permease [Pediococcus acidilactici]KAF0343682.1 amino acid permease [Pediococcus acidilactici]KAF0353247.1 amino acid permease [Pediococcus acidilactici]KAF0357894.1 amino acid permease [Pediococcus acidilactici]KAF0430504.1 amino acid permease [Pediococcus acidilactici]
MNNSKPKQLQKNIGLFAAFSTVMGTVIGAGVFFKVASVTASTQSAGLSLLAWLAGGILTICGGLTSAELAAAIPVTGGAIKYLEASYGKLTGFLMGWAQTLIYFPANIAALSIIFSTQLINLLHLSNGLLVPIAMLCGASVTGVNLLGAKYGARLQSVALIAKLIPLIVIVIWGLGSSSPVHLNLLPANSHFSQTLTGFSGGLLATLFAYDGWLGIGAIAGEMKNPKRDLPLAIGLGLTGIMVVYLVINFIFLRTLPIHELAGNLNAASVAATHLLGNLGGKLVTIGILISVYGALNGYTMTGIRVPYAMALENSLPFSRALKRLSRTSVPYVAGLLQLVIALLMISVGSFDLLTDMLIFVMWIFNVLIFYAVIKLRRTQPELERPYRVPLYPLLPIVAILGGTFVLVMTIINQPVLAITGIIITLLGIPVFLATNRANR